MKAIETKYYGPTNTKGARIVATDSDGNRASISYPYELSGEAVHRAAADQLCGKMGWPNDLIGGATKRGYVFVFVPEWRQGPVCAACGEVPCLESCGACEYEAPTGER